MDFARHDPRVYQDRLGAFLRAKSPNAKTLARRLECEPATAENYRSGRYWPRDAARWAKLYMAFGNDVLEAVFNPHDTITRLEREVAELEAKLAQARAAEGYSGSARARQEEAPAVRHEDRTAAAVTAPPGGAP